MTQSWRFPQKNYRSFLVINSIAYLGITVHLALIGFFFWLGVEPLVFLNIFSTLIWILGWYVNRLGNHELAITVMISEVIVHTIFVVSAIGWQAGFQYYLLGAIPFSLCNNRLDGKAIIVISSCLCLTFISLDVLNHENQQNPSLSEHLLRAINFINIAISFSAVALISFYFRLASMNLEQELEKLANTDPLTGLLNRRSMQELLETQRSLSSRSGLNFTIIFVDIDHFKGFNDTFGHSCGDYVLCEVASFMKNHLRLGDAIARWGGEEFLIMLPDTSIKGARTIAEKIRLGVAEKHFHLAGNDFSVTLTLGLSQHEHQTTIDESLKRADEALYQGKLAGRNLVMG
jgi:diguanylate cyclase (GGDEF)-like protein